jgi:hypothetical protein
MWRHLLTLALSRIAGETNAHSVVSGVLSAIQQQTCGDTE